MKVEVEYYEIENLQKENAELRKENQELNERLNMFNPDQLEKEQIELAQAMFTSVLERVFIDIGYTSSLKEPNIDFTYLQYKLGKQWYDSPKLDITVGASISNKFKKAFIDLGIDTDS